MCISRSTNKDTWLQAHSEPLLEIRKSPCRPASLWTFLAGVPHRWWNAGEDLLEFNGRIVPVIDLDRFLQAIFAVVNASQSGRPSLFYVAHILRRHRQTQELKGVPVAIQKVVFPVVLLIGRILGKYRGDNWPGSPASSTGAPEK